MRDYTEITDRLIKLHLPQELIGTVYDYPIYKLYLQSTIKTQNHVLLTSGLHGDEPGGIEASLQFLSRDNSDLLKLFNFTVIPCINPYGYVHNTRENRDGVDINRMFESNEIKEVMIIKECLGETQFSFTIDFHEDYDATGFYMYEGQEDNKFIGPDIAQQVTTIGPMDTEDSGEDTTPIVKGVYNVSPKWGAKGLAPYMLHHHTKHVLITETPTDWQIEQRAALHLGLLDAALEYY
ncbi:M14 family metallocarboxypeptidase [Candidatus Poribacteria bacterium]|nr:M14 family metallocarboxypeptidase [Candidatus Poribacteria bacterium]